MKSTVCRNRLGLPNVAWPQIAAVVVVNTILVQKKKYCKHKNLVQYCLRLLFNAIQRKGNQRETKHFFAFDINHML